MSNMEVRKSEVEEARELQKAPRRHGDRKDGKFLKDLDSMHQILAIVMGERTSNEAFISEKIDLTKTMEYIDRRNKEMADGKKLSLFGIMVAASLKVMALRPRMNRFICNGRVYLRNEISASFVVRDHFNDNGQESLAYITADENDNLDSIFKKMTDQMEFFKTNVAEDPCNKYMDFFMKKMPRTIGAFFVRRIVWLDRHGWVPQFFIDGNMYYCSAVLTYLGSIRLGSGYHHLTNWGSNSFFMTIGERKPRPFISRHGGTVVKDSIDIGITIDERLADGYYYSKTVRLFKTLVENPELLEKTLYEEVTY